jgi:hypothetical protein
MARVVVLVLVAAARRDLDGHLDRSALSAFHRRQYARRGGYSSVTRVIVDRAMRRNFAPQRDV